jgi:hypothetical protein
MCCRKTRIKLRGSGRTERWGEVKQENYMKSEEVEEEKPRDQLEHETKAITEETIKQFRLQDDEGLTLCTLLITMV